MLAQTLKYWYAARESYWFVPTLMAVGAALLALVLGWVDTAIGDQWPENTDWFTPNHPEGARTMLSTIAGSMITVAGVTFSITMAAVAYAASQFGPRLLTNFMRDQGNQFTLGTFIAAFVYCLFTLRNVRTVGEGFVPHVSLIGALFLAMASIAVLIYFIHHVTESIHISNVVAGIGSDLEKTLARRSEENDREAHPAEAEHDPRDHPARVPSPGNGYIQHLVQSRLMDIASESDTVVEIRRQPGDFVHYGQTLAWVWPADKADDELLRSMARTYALGRSRTIAEDLLFLVDELVEIAARALSPGINDPFTAMSCLDWLRIALVRFATTASPSAYHYDKDDQLRLIRHPMDLEDLLNAVYARLRPYFCADPSAACHMIASLGHLADAVPRQQHKLLIEHADALVASADTLLAAEADKARVRAVYEQVIEGLQTGDLDAVGWT